MKYILFVMFFGGDPNAPVPTITAVEFESEQACSFAADATRTNYDGNKTRVRPFLSMWCVPKGTPAPTP
jgi:hypothetical protein